MTPSPPQASGNTSAKQAVQWRESTDDIFSSDSSDSVMAELELLSAAGLCTHDFKNQDHLFCQPLTYSCIWGLILGLRGKNVVAGGCRSGLCEQHFAAAPCQIRDSSSCSIGTHCCQKWVMSNSGKVDLRKGKNSAQQQPGERKYKRSSPAATNISAEREQEVLQVQCAPPDSMLHAEQIPSSRCKSYR